jgi:hypothetical protein
MIVDFSNPVSMRYAEMSIQSLKPISDLINVIPVQCTVPSTLPTRYPARSGTTPFYVSDNGTDYLRDRYYGGTFCDNRLYNCIMHSHMTYIERIAKGEECFILEHDAALVNQDSFREMFDMFWGADTFFPGACMEFYSLSQRMAQWMVDIMDNFPLTQVDNGYHKNERFSGPMGVLSHADKDVGAFNFGSGSFLMPTKNSDLDKICFNHSMDATFKAKGIGGLFEPAFKQYYFTKSKNTNAPDYSDIMEDETLEFSESGPSRSDFIFVDA